MEKAAARYASQPSLPLPPLGGAPNNFSTTFPFRPGMQFSAALNNAKPNPVAAVKPPQVGTATVGGIQQAMKQAKLAMLKEALMPTANLATMPPATAQTAGMPGGGAPMPGQAGAPAAPPIPGQGPMTPPPGSAMDPSQQGAPPAQGDPSQQGAPTQIDPATGQPIAPPMGAPPPSPLPSNPRMEPPRPQTMPEMQQEQNLQYLFAQKNAPMPLQDDTPEEDVNDEIMAIGGKVAWFNPAWKNFRGAFGRLGKAIPMTADGPVRPPVAPLPSSALAYLQQPQMQRQASADETMLDKLKSLIAIKAAATKEAGLPFDLKKWQTLGNSAAKVFGKTEQAAARGARVMPGLKPPIVKPPVTQPVRPPVAPVAPTPAPSSPPIGLGSHVMHSAFGAGMGGLAAPESMPGNYKFWGHDNNGKQEGGITFNPLYAGLGALAFNPKMMGGPTSFGAKALGNAPAGTQASKLLSRATGVDGLRTLGMGFRGSVLGSSGGVTADKIRRLIDPNYTGNDFEVAGRGLGAGLGFSGGLGTMLGNRMDPSKLQAITSRIGNAGSLGLERTGDFVNGGMAPVKWTLQNLAAKPIAKYQGLVTRGTMNPTNGNFNWAERNLLNSGQGLGRAKNWAEMTGRAVSLPLAAGTAGLFGRELLGQFADETKNNFIVPHLKDIGRKTLIGKPLIDPATGKAMPHPMDPNREMSDGLLDQIELGANQMIDRGLANRGLLNDKGDITGTPIIQNSARELGLMNDQNQWTPENVINLYLQRQGLMNANNQFTPLNALAHSGAFNQVDRILQMMGMNPQAMSPQHKMMLLGGTAVGAGGLLTGHPLLAAAGGLAAGYGGLQQGGWGNGAYSPRQLWDGQGGDPRVQQQTQIVPNEYR